MQNVAQPTPSRKRIQAPLVSIVVALASPASSDAIDVAHIVQATANQIAHSTVIVERQSDGQMWTSNFERAQQRFSPASTSKIPHTLIALERGLAIAETVFSWDGAPRSSRAWNQDHNLTSAFQHSVVWVYQEIARNAGQDVLSEGLASFDYGNANVGSLDQLTTYWLDGTLQISAAEQMEFLRRLVAETLPLSESTYLAARDIMVSDYSDTWVVRSKTGWHYNEQSMDVGWYVGWMECPNDTYIFALNMDLPDTRYLSRRKAITYFILQEIGAFDCE